MKRIFYPFRALANLSSLFLLFSLFCTLIAEGQSYIISYTGSPPAVGSGAANLNDGAPIEVGVKFRVTQIGTVSAIRFWKGNLNTGQHIGNLWLANGTNLASVTFTGETASGWQEMAFSTPISVTPGNIYVASYYSDDNIYAATNNYFNNGVEVGTSPVIALCDCNVTSPFNGIYLLTSSGSVFPTNTFQGSNYWVNVRFTPTFPLPVNLLDLNATTNNKDITVSWNTSSETNNKGFQVERSNNGADWYSIGFVNGAGESSTIKSYSYTDRTLAPGLYYYRINQQDFDGRSKISTTVTASISGKGQVSLFQNYPNPFRGNSSIRFDLPTAQKVRLSVVDLTGREVKVLTDKLGEAGTHQVSFSSDGLGTQLYIIRLQTESGILTRKMLIQ